MRTSWNRDCVVSAPRENHEIHNCGSLVSAINHLWSHPSTTAPACTISLTDCWQAFKFYGGYGGGLCCVQHSCPPGLFCTMSRVKMPWATLNHTKHKAPAIQTPHLQGHCVRRSSVPNGMYPIFVCLPVGQSVLFSNRSPSPGQCSAS